MPEERQQWNSRVGFVMAAIGSAVGLGNVWRFPYVCAKFGGGAFLIPYFAAIILLGIPLLILEFGIGHMMISAAPRSLAKMRRNSEWVGWFAVLNALVITIFYVAVMSWCANYLVLSFIPEPSQAVEGTQAAATSAPMWGADTKGFFFDDVLHVFRNPETGKPSGALFPLGALRPWIVAGYAFIWVCIFLIIYKGVGVVGKVVMWTVPLPLVLLGVLFFSEIGRLGAIDGIRQYLTPDFSHLTDPDVWRAAFGQVFFSLTLGFGVMIAYASYLKRKSDITNNALITTMANCGTSFFAGFVIFSTVGYLAMAKGQTVLQTAGEGGALAFIIYPDAIRRLGEYAPLFGGIFFLMLLLLGIDSAFSLVEGAASALVEKTGRKHAGITAVICVIGFSVGLVFCTRAGGNWVDWANHICNDIGLPLVMLLQCIVAGWLFGAHRIQDHINEVSELRVGRWWTFMIRVVCPLLIGGIFVATTIGDIAKIRAGKLALGPYIGQWCLLLGLLVISVLLMVYRRRKEVIE